MACYTAIGNQNTSPTHSPTWKAFPTSCRNSKSRCRMRITTEKPGYLRKGGSEVAQLCPTLRDPVDCSLPGSSIHGILQTSVLECIAISSSGGSSRPRDRPESPTLQADSLLSEPSGNPDSWLFEGRSINQARKLHLLTFPPSLSSSSTRIAKNSRGLFLF